MWTVLSWQVVDRRQQLDRSRCARLLHDQKALESHRSLLRFRQSDSRNRCRFCCCLRNIFMMDVFECFFFLEWKPIERIRVCWEVKDKPLVSHRYEDVRTLYDILGKGREISCKWTNFWLSLELIDRLVLIVNVSS